MHYLYIVHSAKVDHYYIGETMDLERRLQEHNQGVFKGCLDQYQKLGRSLQNFRFLQKMEIGKSSRIIEVVFA